MRKVILCLLLFSFNANAKTGWDKAAHFAVSGAATAGLYYSLRAFGFAKHEAAWDSFALMSLAGAAKEFYLDQQPDRGDFTANELGALVGITVSILTFE